MNYIQFDFEIQNQEQLDQLVALLNEQNFEGFEEEENFLKAFIPENNFNEKEFEYLTSLFTDLVYTQSVVKNINWNEQWESSFEPVQVDGFVAIRANFHPPIASVAHEIIITPKMSFGTGHHATTYLMLQQMQHIDFKGKSVFDFGTGTGVLAILAEKLGATKIVAIDNDEWSISNAKENIENNNCTAIKIYQANAIEEITQFDIVLANINLNVIVNNIQAIAAIAKKGATILLSGFLKSDEEIMKATLQQQFIYVNTLQKNEWVCMVCKK
jgi:ribosomal protein L11 methyltransferase